ncbi:hypothetical protein [Pseudoalteromonas arctica]|uniref:Uncharacterized protein n=1 Tax=Pseudoalteromonas arctica TaxID=394751 RepID=A0A7Y0H9T6_9GAMM|nr:hypothetical protein [Pseudoalteromonas arctica]NMM39921.1 hypothetical protein [Pseudoalteromonas arctica]
MKNIPLFLLLALVSTSALAVRTDCPSAKIVHIQMEGTKIMYLQEGAPWRTLGYINSNDGTKERYSALLTAQATGSKVIVGYSGDDYDCGKTNYSTAAYMVRTFSQ